MSRGVKLVPLALLLAALAELVVFTLAGRWLGFNRTVLLVLAGSLLGLFVLRREGVRAWRGFRAAVDSGRPPGKQVTDGLVGLAGGLLLAAPGLLTGGLGLLLVTPPVRGLVRREIQRAVERRLSSAAAGGLFGPRRVRVWLGRPYAPQEPGPTIDGEVVEPH